MAHMSSARALVRFPSLLRKRRSFRVVIKQITIRIGKPGHTAGLAEQPWSRRTRRQVRVYAQSPAARAFLLHWCRFPSSLFPLGMGLLTIVFPHHTRDRRSSPGLPAELTDPYLAPGLPLPTVPLPGHLSSRSSSSAPRLVLPDFPETRARCAVLSGATGQPRRRLKGGRGR
jgi:hypothetical protein